MNKELVKSVVVRNPDSITDKFIAVFDGTGLMKAKNNSVMEVKFDDRHLYIPYVGNVYKSKFPDLEDGEVTDESIIQQLKDNLI